MLPNASVTVLTFTPGVVAVTFTEKVHVSSENMPPPKPTDEDPGSAVTVPPLQPDPSPLNPLGVATTKPLGKLSVKLSETPPIFAWIEKLSEVVPPTMMLATPNDFVNVVNEICARAGPAAVQEGNRRYYREQCSSHGMLLNQPSGSAPVE